MPKVLLATIDYPPQDGGVARYLYALTTSLKDTVDVLYWDKAVFRLQMLRDIIRRSKYVESVWVSHVLPVGTMAFLAGKITGVPYVVFLHGLDFDLARRNAWKRWLTRRVLRDAHHVVTNSRALAREVKLFADIAMPLVVYPTVSDDFVEAARASDLTDKGMNNAKVRLLTVSRLVERKGHIRVLHAIKDIPNVEYYIVGDGPYRKKIEQTIQKFGLESRVHVLGKISDKELVSLYQQSDIFVMPTVKTETDREGFGIVYLEAQLFGVPVIASNQPGVDEAVIDRFGGILVQDGEEALKEALNMLIESPGIRRNLGYCGRDYVLRNFIREKQCTKLNALLD